MIFIYPNAGLVSPSPLFFLVYKSNCRFYGKWASVDQVYLALVPRTHYRLGPHSLVAELNP